jgi:hypothetical protein
MNSWQDSLHGRPALYLHRKQASIYPTIEWDSNPRSQVFKLANKTNLSAYDLYRLLFVIVNIFMQTVEQKKNRTPLSESANELYRPSDRRLSAKWLPTFVDK